MNLNSLLEMQAMLIILMLLGIFLTSIGMIKKEGRDLLMDLVIDVTLPCSIVNSFLIEFNGEILKSALAIFIVSIVIQFGSLLLGRILYRSVPESRKKVLQYATACSNAGILGNPIAEGAFGSIGLLYASIYLIPLRTFMWSFGVTYFTECPSRKELVKKVVTHPCIIAVAVGLLLMITQVQLPGVVSTTLQTLGGANTAVSMLLIGSLLGGVRWREMVNRESLYYCFVRLILIPGLVCAGCFLFGVDTLVTGVSVLLAAMPAASVTAVMAAKYDKDAAFAARLVALSTILSMITAPAWCLLFVGL